MIILHYIRLNSFALHIILWARDGWMDSWQPGWMDRLRCFCRILRFTRSMPMFSRAIIVSHRVEHAIFSLHLYVMYNKQLMRDEIKQHSWCSIIIKEYPRVFPPLHSRFMFAWTAVAMIVVKVRLLIEIINV